jgi:N-acyl-phosphatidylethanolamine-hydrolysing phospholipase D
MLPYAVRAGALLVALTALSSCANKVNPYFDATKLHHRVTGFQNNFVEFEPKRLLTLLRWQIESAAAGLPRPPVQHTPRIAPDLGFIHANAGAGARMEPALTWIGHATVLAQFAGINLLTDPHFGERASPLSFAGPRRALPPGLKLEELPRIDVVVISHNHYDHLDDASVRALNAQAGGPPLFVVPLGVKPWLAERGIGNAVELDWWQSHRVGGVEIFVVPVQHWSGRSLADRMCTLWAGYAVFADDFHLYFAGDTGYSKDFAEVRQRFRSRQGERGFDAALIPVGAYEPRWFMNDQHVNPAEAVRVHRDLEAQRSLGIHWGTFALTDESLDEPPRELAKARREQGVADDEFFVIAVGETRRLPRRKP